MDYNLDLSNDALHGSIPASNGYQTYPKHNTAFQHLKWYTMCFFVHILSNIVEISWNQHHQGQKR